MDKQILLEVWHRIEFECDIIVARADASKLAEDAGFSRKECNEISISVSELGTNILKYACPGMLAYRIIEDQKTVFEVMAADWGKGIADVDLAMRDFHTELGPVMTMEGYVRPLNEGLGCGLSAVKRLMTSLVVETAPQKGTRVFATKVRKR
jgi:serine/threonine-protein kinase RsbT